MCFTAYQQELWNHAKCKELTTSLRENLTLFCDPQSVLFCSVAESIEFYELNFQNSSL